MGDPLVLRSRVFETRSRDRIVSVTRATLYPHPPTTWRTTLAKAASMKARERGNKRVPKGPCYLRMGAPRLKGVNSLKSGGDL
ncbi:hypothetical protein CRG98_030158 [Punica granatum]|uniref:Uncharacterized protein n=1 Tax=Punica granatum TaxID=22663 RepID=A0A2I0J146_PUNGR|nr:hypothetical protein CRG98_030158 [Punica granatum]